MAKRTLKRVLVTLHFLKFNPSELVTFIRELVTLLTGSTYITTPVVSTATMTSQADALDLTNQQRLVDKSSTLTTQSDMQVNDCLSSATYIAEQLETVANMTANGDVTAAKNIIEGLGFVPKKDAVRPGRFFEVFKVEAQKAWLRCPASNRGAIYMWRFTTTPANPDSWSRAFSTKVSEINLTQLTADGRYYFQYATINDGGRNNSVDSTSTISWTDPISALIPA